MTELIFKGKEFVYNHHLAVPHRPLLPDANRSEGAPDMSGNLIIQGDNLHALKALLPFYAGKVDCILIDPPYNTGKEDWRYNDNVNAPMIKEWLKDNPVSVDDALRHDKWSTMMWPRLKLLHELLAEDGVIIIHIDDNEVHRLRLLLDEIFGEQNFITSFTWKRRSSSAMSDLNISLDHEYVLVFQKCSFSGFRGDQKTYQSYSNSNNDSRGAWTLGDLSVGMDKSERPNQFYDLVHPVTGNSFSPNPNRVWSYIYETMKEKIRDGRIYFPDDIAKSPMLIRFKSELKSDVNPVSSWIETKGKKSDNDNIVSLSSGLNSEGTKTLQAIFKSKVFNYPKPVSLVKELIFQSTSTDALILDSFAGSGTTAHAVLAANKEDGGNRKFILVEMEEDIAVSVTAERVRRVINGYEHKNKKTDGLSGSFTYCTLGEPIELNNILKGNTLPAYADLAPILFHMATSKTLVTDSINPDGFVVGETEGEKVWMIYKPDLAWLKSDEAALTLSCAQRFYETDVKKRHLVFAPLRFVSEGILRHEKLNVAFIPFPSALYRMVKET